MLRFRRSYFRFGSANWHLGLLSLWLLVFFLIMATPAFAVTRFDSRMLFIYNNEPSVATKYKVSFIYNTVTTVGSIDLLFCQNPIPYVPCVPPVGLDASNAVLSDQTGETGFSITQKSPTHLVISRAPSQADAVLSSYTFDNIINPSNTSKSFAIRLSDYASVDTSGPAIDIGSVLSSIGRGILIEAQVPPILVFCVAHQVADDCSDSSGGNYSQMGTLNPSNTLTATSQMAAGTNASRGYTIAVYGPTLTASSHTIDSLSSPTPSAPGNNQFGINLRANLNPGIGQDPDGAFANAVPAPNYDQPNKFTYNDGDIVASAPNVSLVRRFTVSYIVNSEPGLYPGIYTGTYTFICSGRF